MVSICHGAAHAVKSHGIQGCRIGWKGEVYYDGEEEGTMNDDFSLFIYILYIMYISLHSLSFTRPLAVVLSG
jgi:hypothetical protein